MNPPARKEPRLEMEGESVARFLRDVADAVEYGQVRLKEITNQRLGKESWLTLKWEARE